MRGDDVQQDAMFSYLSPKLECPETIRSGRSGTW